MKIINFAFNFLQGALANVFGSRPLSSTQNSIMFCGRKDVVESVKLVSSVTDYLFVYLFIYHDNLDWTGLR